MENNKDNFFQSKGQSLLSTDTGLEDVFFINASQKAQKLTSALYMVTGFLEKDEPLKDKLKSASVQLLSDTMSFRFDDRLAKKTSLNQLLSHTNKIISLLEVAYTVGLISEMNFSILRNEFSNFKQSVEKEITQRSELRPLNESQTNTGDEKNQELGAGFLLSEKMFSSDQEQTGQDLTERKSLSKRHLKDIKSKRTSLNNEGLNKRHNNLVSASAPSKGQDNGEKDKRQKDILSLIKSRKEVSINDIVQFISGCSAKTIQRDLNQMVKDGKIVKDGKKRWTKYRLS